jgi:hypothetical protein
LENPLERYGQDMRVPDLRWEISQCRRHGKMHDVCMVRYIDLIPITLRKTNDSSGTQESPPRPNPLRRDHRNRKDENKRDIHGKYSAAAEMYLA